MVEVEGEVAVGRHSARARRMRKERERGGGGDAGTPLGLKGGIGMSLSVVGMSRARHQRRGRVAGAVCRLLAGDKG